jgi:hypothetical protein
MKSLLEKSEDVVACETDRAIFDAFQAYLERLGLLIENEEEAGGKDRPFVIARIFEDLPGTDAIELFLFYSFSFFRFSIYAFHQLKLCFLCIASLTDTSTGLVRHLREKSALRGCVAALEEPKDHPCASIDKIINSFYAATR